MVQDHLEEIRFYRSHRTEWEREDDVEHVKQYATTLFANVDPLLTKDELIKCMSTKTKPMIIIEPSGLDLLV